MRPERLVLAFVLAAAIAFPFAASALGDTYYVSFVRRVLIYALAATSLNLLVGLGGMVSFGHAAFFGAGAYAVAILARAPGGIGEAGWIAWPAAAAAAALLALFVGAVSLRTRGLYFIMITLAFAQMIYYLFVSLKGWGGEDGIALERRSSLPGLDLAHEASFYYLVLALNVAALLALARLGRARFGRAIEGIRENETRMRAIGFPVYRYRLVCFVVAGALAGLAGALMVNQTGLASPSLLDWKLSGQLLVMVILGGTGSVYGGAIGAFVLLVLEEALSAYTGHWPLVVGAVLLVVVLKAPGGIAGIFRRGA